MRKIITTCGTSLLESCCWKPFGSQTEGLNSKHLSQIKDESEKRAHEYHCREAFNKFIIDKKISNNGIDEIPQESIEEVAKKFDRFSWDGSAKDKGGDANDNFEYLRDLPAELASLRAIEHVLHEEPFTKDDEILLLCSDTIDGKFCAAVIKKVLINHKLVPCNVEVKPITDLDFENHTSHDDEKVAIAHKNLWNEFFLGQPDYTDYIFNLTGGYKSLVILLGAVAYKKSTKARIYYLNEKSKRDKILIMHFDHTYRPNNTVGVSGCITRYCKISECTHEQHRKHPGGPSI